MQTNNWTWNIQTKKNNEFLCIKTLQLFCVDMYLYTISTTTTCSSTCNASHHLHMYKKTVKGWYSTWISAHTMRWKVAGTGTFSSSRIKKKYFSACMWVQVFVNIKKKSFAFVILMLFYIWECLSFCIYTMSTLYVYNII